MFFNPRTLLPMLLGWFITQTTSAQSVSDVYSQLAAFANDSAKVVFLEQTIDSLYQTQPKQALTFADVADSLLQNIDSLAWTLEIQRLKALAFRESGQYLVAEQLLTQQLQHLPSTSSPVLQATAVKLRSELAVILRRRGDFPASVAQSQTAIRQMDSLVALYPAQTDYLSYQSAAFVGLAITYARSGNFVPSNRYFQNALKNYRQLNNQERANTILFNLGSNFFSEEQYDSAKFYWNTFISQVDTSQQHPLLPAIYNNLGAVATKQQQWKEAQQYYQQLLTVYKQRGNIEGEAKGYDALAYLYLQMEDYSLAAKTARQGLSLPIEELRIKSRLNNVLADAYRNLSQYPQAAESYRMYAMLQDSLLNQERLEAIAEMEAKYQNEQKEKELALTRQEIELLNQNNQIRQLERNLLAAGLLLLIFVGFFVLRTQQQKVRRKQEQLKNSKALVASIKENAQLKEQRLLQELEHRNQQLTSYTLNFVQKSELMNGLYSKVEELQKQKQWTTHDFRKLKMHIQQHVGIDQDWENFRLYFESVHPDFFHNLTASFPDLGPKELKLCALIRLNMNIKESAVVLGISPDSVKTARHRLRKKMNLDYQESMLDVLMQVEKGKRLSDFRQAS